MTAPDTESVSYVCLIDMSNADRHHTMHVSLGPEYPHGQERSQTHSTNTKRIVRHRGPILFQSLKSQHYEYELCHACIED